MFAKRARNYEYNSNYSLVAIGYLEYSSTTSKLVVELASYYQLVVAATLARATS